MNSFFFFGGGGGCGRDDMFDNKSKCGFFILFICFYFIFLFFSILFLLIYFLIFLYSLFRYVLIFLYSFYFIHYFLLFIYLLTYLFLIYIYNYYFYLFFSNIYIYFFFLGGGGAAWGRDRGELVFLVCGGSKRNLKKCWGEGGEGWGAETKTVCQMMKWGKTQKSNYLHNVEDVIQPTFWNMLITF